MNEPRLGGSKSQIESNLSWRRKRRILQDGRLILAAALPTTFVVVARLSALKVAFKAPNVINVDCEILAPDQAKRSSIIYALWSIFSGTNIVPSSAERTAVWGL